MLYALFRGFVFTNISINPLNYNRLFISEAALLGYGEESLFTTFFSGILVLDSPFDQAYPVPDLELLVKVSTMGFYGTGTDK